jgi:hypothetical protein
VVEPNRTPVRRSGGSVTRRRGRKSRRRSSSSGGGGRASFQKRLIGVAIGGGAYGLIEKSFPSLPTLPLVGKSGTIAVLAYFAAGNNQLLQDIGVAAAAIAGYSLGKEGKISGDFDF